jgi:hypothetical protein
VHRSLTGGRLAPGAEAHNPRYLGVQVIGVGIQVHAGGSLA